MTSLLLAALLLQAPQPQPQPQPPQTFADSVRAALVRALTRVDTVRDTVRVTRVDTVVRVDTVRVPHPAPVDTTPPTGPADSTVTDSLPPVATPAPVGATPELPRATVDVAWPALSGRVLVADTGVRALQAALDSARAGDVVELPAGATYVGQVTLRRRADTGWVVVRSSGVTDAAFPAPGVRVAPRDTLHMARILAATSAPALRTAPGAAGWRIVGVEIGAVATLTGSYGLVALGEGTTSLQRDTAQVPRRLILDRVYVHGHDALHVRRCVALHSAETAIVDSYLDACHSNQGDSQAIMGWNGPGPFTIVNNYLAAGHEVVFFGGPTPGIAGLIPSDITIRRNHLTRPLAWKGVWGVKNLFECKSCQRVLLEENVLEHNWLSAQPGFAIVLQGLSDSNDAPQNRVWDVTIRRNVIRHTAAGINLLSRVGYATSTRPALLPDEPMRRVAVTDNLIVVGGGPGGIFDGNRRMVQILQDVRDLTIARNTFVGALGTTASTQLMFDGTKLTERLVVERNVFGPATYGVTGNGAGGIPNTLAKFAPDAVLRGNVFTALPLAHQIPGNSYPLTLGATLPGAPRDDYTGPPTVGADVAAVLRATAGVVTP